MLKKLLFVSILFSGLSLVLVACGSSTASTSSTANTANISGPQIHMGKNTFTQASIAIKKGESLTVVSDTSNQHVIANGTWENDTAKPAREPGAPAVKDIKVEGNTITKLGPFTTAGTFKLYCPLHHNMNLTVIVQ
ncbi:hypothetical protein EPA93_31655 [Ktedonosporobacter rubrisoli]|uniref:Blue (type 1) copper domain-containing protein n=1 Tax=Ktedonosporobacter rubrisoli TaxID=2509675 RepID=A0A4P6JYY3_KTERU|nr:hypothetical protein [Ktedonosporobacter rubrisoli]QBD80286.1 hypothetical protein EPA93_31655 [Ktedonosporobacter rubrisoli]